MSMFNDISCDRKGNKDECLANAGVVKVFARRFGVGQWSFIGPGSEKKWYSAESSSQRAWDKIAEEMLLEFAESGILPSVPELCGPEALRVFFSLLPHFRFFFSLRESSRGIVAVGRRSGFCGVGHFVRAPAAWEKPTRTIG